METVTVQLKHTDAKKLLKELENLDLIKIIEQASDEIPLRKPSQLRGFLHHDNAEKLLTHVEETRNEW